ncbi:hypothetical protein CANARDRAFT_28176 [[Candida] arabinofermentans NRRL YB-2248]|uniref:Phospholipid-transporting ATPase n=1 Tax=[Candida] arabinofermentans NRRL YB-2248 TaxID=983967 RepID=A0A1E4T0Z9_9ASCO|nr:hypothetical protein CANARDRAFT_28176 [[Candida] arabinofermentans NRRL YB-2248]
MNSSNSHLDDPFYLPPTSEEQISKPESSRKRAFSLRTQILNKKINQSVDTYLNDPKSSSSPSDYQQPDIELKSVDNTYSPNDNNPFRYEEELEYGDLPYQSHRAGAAGFSLDESIVDLDREPLNNKFSTFTPNVVGRFESAKRLMNALIGRSNPLPSLGGRTIPISLNIENSDEPFLFDVKQKRNLLLDKRNRKPYCNNVITSSKYTIFSFLPRQLIAQFSKLANCYFLIVSILQLIPSWSTTGTSTTIIPLSIFISISILREGYDDLRRHRLDKSENNRVTTVLKSSKETTHPFHQPQYFNKSKTSISRLRNTTTTSFDLNLIEEDEEEVQASKEVNSFTDGNLLRLNGVVTQKTRWKNLKVGEIIKLQQDEWVPADIILLTSTNEMGEALVETMALDGETNLKSKVPNQEIHKICNTAQGINQINASTLVEDPNLDLYNFEGSLDFESNLYPLGPDNVIYRGSIIRNTTSCLGLVIFSGEETKIRMNAIKNPRIKAPKLQKSINMIVAFMVMLVLSLSVFSLMGERLLYSRYKNLNWYIMGEDAGVAATVMGFIIMYNTLIPLSLYVTMEIIKVMQMLLLQWDVDMYHVESNTPAEARTATILEELGQVSYIFTDKTGTLTDNIMIFRKFSVCGTAWLHDMDMMNKTIEDDYLSPTNSLNPTFSPRQGSVRFNGRPSMASLTNKQSMNPSLVTAKTASQLQQQQQQQQQQYTSLEQNIKSSSEFIRYLSLNPNTLYAKKAKLFLLSIALCHSCLPKKVTKESAELVQSSSSSISFAEGTNTGITGQSEENDDDLEIDYQASSPDELALVQAAGDMGYIVWDRKQKKLTLKVYPNGFDQEPIYENYEVLEIVEFSSSRKRMSVVVRFPDNRIVLLCKGADNIILERLKDSQLAESKKQEIERSISQRKRAEADYILHRRSTDLVRDSMELARSSIGSLNRTSIQISRHKSTHSQPILLNDENGDSELNGIQLQSRNSIQLKQAQKYNLKDELSYIPSEKLLLNQEYILEKTIGHIDEFSTEGLRTLMYSYKNLDESTYQSWSDSYAKAKTSLTDRAKSIEEVGCLLENDLELLGATAIEDKLQHGVPEAIEKLRRAGIKLWMLTGDKRETAINIGYSCKLIKDYSKVVILSNDTDQSDLSSLMAAAELEITEGNVAHCVVVVDGSTLADIENDTTLLTLFISLGMHSDSVICCRASPSQKANMVTQVRNLNKDKVTLAIGDGANDIAMIQSADVGVGITGKEGLQAARTSDYSIAQFMYLLKLLLVHGRYNYIRTSKFVLCTFYKELFFYLTQLLYQRYTLFTGSSLYESWSLSMFNTLFTSLPVLCIGMFDRDLRASTLLAVPELYSLGRLCQSFNLKLFIMWVLLATCQSVTLCFILWNIYGFGATLDNTTYPLGFILFTVLIIIINTKCNIIEIHAITKIMVISWTVSVVGWILWCMVIAGLYGKKDNYIFYVAHGLFQHFGKDPTLWGTILMLVLIGLTIDFIFHIVKTILWRNDTDVFQMLEKDDELRRKFELNSFEEMKQSWTWLHESQMIEQDIENHSDLKKKLYYARSFLKKGSIHPSEQTRKRKATLVNPSEPLPGSPNIVKIAGSERYEEEMLPSGKIIRKRVGGGGDYNDKTDGAMDKFSKLFKIGNDEEDEDIDEILNRRMRQLQPE